MILKFSILILLTEAVLCKIIKVMDKNELKKELKSHANIIILFYDNERSNINVLKLFEDASEPASKIAKLLTVDCKVSKKLCKQYKVDSNTYVIQHFHKSKFNKIYDRKLRVESLLRFLEDPTGDVPWEEEDTAKDIVHVRQRQDLQKLIQSFKNNIPPLMLMFYAPWCGHCKKMKPEFAAAATSVKPKAIFIGINGDLPDTDDLKQAFNVTGYPSIYLVQEGTKIYRFDSAHTKEALIKFVDNPVQAPTQTDVPWSEETSEIDFLTDFNFVDFISEHDSVLVMFYAPWCGHCKALKPEILQAVKQMKKSQSDGRIAAVDSTENKNISTFYNITGYPMLKYFKAGQFQYDIYERTADGLVKFMADPQKPKEPEKPVPWNEEESAVHHPSVDEFKPLLKRYKHSLVMFYAPWCGHCKKSKPGFTAAANEMKDNVKVAFIAVDCTSGTFSDVCKLELVQGFPTLRYYNYGKTTPYSDYSLEREQDDFVSFMNNPSNPKLDARRHWRQIPGNEDIVVLETENFVQNIVSQPSGALVMFYAPWCGHCNAMKPAFVAAANVLKQSLPSCILGSVDVTTEKNLAAQYKVDGFPTLIYFSPSGDWSNYNGGRTEKDMIDFMIKKDNDIKRENDQKENDEKLQKQAKEEAEKKEKERIEVEKKQKEESERKVREEIERKEKDEIERKKREEVEKKQKEEIERIKREETERKDKDEIERKKREEVEKKQKEEIERKRREEKERKEKDEIERKKIEEKERKEKDEIERKEREEVEKKQKEDIERKNKEEAERKQKEETEQKQKKEAERKQQEEAEKKKEETEKKEKEETEKKKREKVDKKRREDAERKENEEIEAKKIEEAVKKLREEAGNKLKDVKIQKETEQKKKENLVKDNYLTKIDKIDVFEKQIMEPKLTVVYFNKEDKKKHIREKVLKYLEKQGGVVSVEVDCGVLVSVCDQWLVAQYPSLMAFKSGHHLSTVTDTWSEESLAHLINGAIKDEL